MLILHAGLVDNQIVLWAERSVPDTKKSTRGSTKTATRDSAKTAKAKLHPFCLSGDKLLETLGTEVLRAISATGSHLISVQAWLPSTADAPLPSSRLLYPEDYSFEEPSAIACWQVETATVDLLDVARIGDALKSSRVLSPGLIIGGEFAFLSRLIRFAASFVVQQKYLPTIVDREGKFFARWQPVFSAEDHAAIKSLAQATPDVVRALWPDLKKSKAPDTPSLGIIMRFIERYVDSEVRKKAFDVIKYIVMSKGKYLSAHDCWLHSLCTPTGEMNFDLEQLNKFAEQVFEWQRPLLGSEFSPFRLCFKVEEPVANDVEYADSNVIDMSSRTWNVQYVLQDVKDPSLLIPAEDAWSNSAAVQKTFALANFRPREQLLRSLGEASRLSENVGTSLKDPNPTGFKLTNSGAFEFVSEIVPSLQEAGFGVMLPKWWTKGQRKNIKRVGTASPSSMKIPGGMLNLNTVFEFDWKMALGDIELTEEELEILADLKTPLVQIRGQWMIVGETEIQAAIDYLKGKVKSKLTLAEVMKIQLANEDNISLLGARGGKVKLNVPKFVGEFIGQLKEPASMTELNSPQGFVGQLRPYQVRGFSWLYFLSKYGIGACLADDMGLGKTIQTLALVQQIKSEKKAGPVLLICPTSVVTNWCKEAARFTPGLKVMVHHGAKRKKSDKFVSEVADCDLVLATYGLLTRDLETLKSLEWSGVILDEAQNIKNDLTKQSTAARELRAQFRIALTGTPVENTVADLFSLMQFLNPNYLGDSAHFKETFLKPIQVANDSAATARLREITGPLILRRLKTDKTIISDLPDKIESKEYCSLTKEQVSLYTAVLDDVVRQILTIEPQRRAALILSSMMKLKQICNHPAQYNSDTSSLDGRSGKLERLAEMVDEILQNGEKALIFSQFVEMSTLIRRHLQDKFGEEVLFLHGGVPRKQRDVMVERFQSSSGPKLFVISLKAGGTGLNLTAANHVFHYDRWWNPAVENQASDRAFRIGQKKNVQVHKFITAGTLENAIDELIEKKTALSDKIVGTGESWLADLSNDALTKMLSLSAEAYAE